MENIDKPNVVADDLVITMDYKLSVDGEVVDSSEDSEPIEFLQGHGNIIPGLEHELYGMKIGDNKKVQVPAKDAYGEVDETATMEVTRAEFPPEIPLEIGTEITISDIDGDLMDARIAKVDDEKITLDFNHPLAGKDLSFDVTVIEIRAATPEELEHGHTHDSEFGCEDEECDGCSDDR
jgi:FKBP-type peptidyl-prolyl cis-trans isomerase SlyD